MQEHRNDLEKQLHVVKNVDLSVFIGYHLCEIVNRLKASK